MRDVIVIGAGIAGLACARALASAGADVVVVDKSRGVGGRCATRRMTWNETTVPLDHGIAYYSGRDPKFRALLHEVPGGVIEGWPRRIVGEGPPCQPDDLIPPHHHFAFREGAVALPRHLAAGLEVCKQVHVTGVVGGAAGGVAVTRETGEALLARAVVVALPVEQALALPIDAPAARAVLGFFSSRSCLAILGLWPVADDLGFDLCRPGGAVAQIADETTKGRATPPGTRALVIQASPRFSATHLENAPEVWGPLLLEACVASTGPWIREPLVSETHRWRYARIDAGFGLGGPLVTALGDAKVGWCGEAFDPTGGAAGAWRSGVALAARLPWR